MAPYSGSLLRLAFTTAAIVALAAAGFVYWQGGVDVRAFAAPAGTSAPGSG